MDFYDDMRASSLIHVELLSRSVHVCGGFLIFRTAYFVAFLNFLNFKRIFVRNLNSSCSFCGSLSRLRKLVQIGLTTVHLGLSK